MRSLLTVTAAVVLCALAAQADKPVDLPCVTWIKSSDSVPTPDPSDLFVAAHTYVTQYSRSMCSQIGDIIPCFASEGNVDKWGHHDYLAGVIPQDHCRVYYDGAVSKINEFYLPKLGPNASTWKWHSFKKGDTVPLNAIQYQGAVMARSQVSPPGECAGKGFTGWAVAEANNTFGSVHFSIVDAPFTTETFDIAICEAYIPTNAPPTPVPSTETPATPATTFSPTLPPNNKPYIRFANTIPSDNVITATISQGSVSHTWTNYAFAEFSEWVEIFANGAGTLTLASAGKTLLSISINLTPGPLVVVSKNLWPPAQAEDVETIAASYVPVSSGSGVRLFNLSPDTQSASMSTNGKTLVQNIIYNDGSIWATIPTGKANYLVSDFISGATLAEDSFSAPPAPFVFTNFLVGLQNTTDSKFATKLVPLIDAPES